jgi:adenylate cyclase
VRDRKEAPIESTTRATVLFAGVSGISQLYEAAGVARAEQAIKQCQERLRLAARLGGGRVVKALDQDIMAVFPAAAAAAGAAAAMQAAIDALPEVANTKLAVRIAFLTGPVTERNGDFLGDTVNLTARLAAYAKKRQIITSSSTAAALGGDFQGRVRDLRVDAKPGQSGLCELVWGNHLPPHQLLRLRYGSTEVVRRSGKHNYVRIGRDFDCGLIIFDDAASRQHCTVEQRDTRFVLVDHSTNGSFVTEEGDPEIHLQGDSFPLRKHGWLALGQPRAKTGQVVEYFCD